MKISTKNFLYLFVLLMLVWFALASSLNYQMLIFGILVSLILSIFFSKVYLELELPPLSIKRIVYFIIYVFVLFKEIAKANVDVAYRVLHPKMPIRPGVVVIKTKLKRDIAKLILANSITLTPGTFTLDILGDNLLVHWINVKTEDSEEATKIISEKFERYLRVAFN
ncbi:MAG: Na+/H+ antiporter subunit E [Candidatus Omnitrophica bacterium]|nr:Na+/H+ antiporter subunit E [Candidatus Omnitrophota bacterium]